MVLLFMLSNVLFMAFLIQITLTYQRVQWLSSIFLGSFNDWEMEEVERFLQVLHRQKIRLFMEDKFMLKGLGMEPSL